MVDERRYPEIDVTEDLTRDSSLVDQYEEQVQADCFPDIGQMLESIPDEHRISALTKLILVDMEHRWKRTQGKTVDEYLAEFPEVKEHEELVGRLLQSEQNLQERYDLPPTFSVGAETDTVVDLPATRRTIDRFKVQGELGRGHFGVVYRAFDPKLERLVAIKVSLTKSKVDSAEGTLLDHEAKAVAQVRHSSIVPVLDIGITEDGYTYVVYEHVSGKTLDRRIAEGDYTMEEAIGWVVSLARGLHAAHRKHLVHRDVKPGNILIAEDGTAHLTDFGLAQLEDKFVVQERNSIIGTPHYMSPEQATGRSGWATPASDIHSLGVVLYELLTGQRPFDAENSMELLDEVIHRPPVALRTLCDDIPASVEDVCLKALEKDPQARPRTGDDLAEALQAAMRPRSPWLLWTAILTILVLAITAPAIWLFVGPDPVEIVDMCIDIQDAAGRSGNRWDNHPLRGDDKIAIFARTNKEAYFYGFIYHTHATAPVPISPPTPSEAPQRMERLYYPPRNADEDFWSTPDSSGTILVLVGATRKPLSQEKLRQLKDLSLVMPSAPSVTQSFVGFAKPPVTSAEKGVDWRGDREERFLIDTTFITEVESILESCRGIMFSYTPEGARAEIGRPIVDVHD
jgi:serine/threonine protein kinase